MILSSRKLAFLILFCAVISIYNNTGLDASYANSTTVTTPTKTDIQGSPSVCADGSIIYLKPKVLSSNPNQLDLRKHFRFESDKITHPIKINTQKYQVTLLNLSREGIGLAHNNTIKNNDVIPVTITYKDLEIHTQAKIVYASSTNAGGMFLPQDENTRNELLYLSVMLESDNNMITRRIYN